MRVPTESEMRDAGERLGILVAGDPITPRVRAKLAKVVTDALAEDEASAGREKSGDALAAPLIDTYQRLTGAGMSDASAGRIVAALAPIVYRKTQGS